MYIFYIDKFEKAKNRIDRKILLEAAKNLNITHKDNIIIVDDIRMKKLSGHNKYPKIIKLYNLFQNKNIFENINSATIEAINLYTNNHNCSTMVINKDTNIISEIWKSGIKKTFSKNVPKIKTDTANIIKEIIEEGIYSFTSITMGENNILYHHFLTAIKVYNNDNNVFIRTVLKEYIDRNDLPNKFYYHQFEYFNIEKEMPRPAALQSSENQDFDGISSTYSKS